ncbi:uncharacterized protein M6B38_281180 [Iris pallida]|uniref:Uncharacterized protein n=1 Tax=Iris pallida TaxID=29817 RepID=A0AAX6E1A6_IRIPA|nr:Uncharacterized protein M6B38_218085 [Iris pallida]KAJ6847332.1 uncharacterized protein M6B38_281180 [Iris pallida]
MEGVGARLGRSSTRYGGPVAVFSGPVRKWKKKWVPLTSTTLTNNHSSNNNSSSSPSNLVLYKWTPISKEDTITTTTTTDSAADAEPQRRKFRYVPIAVIEEQKQEVGAKSDDENKPEDGDPAQHPSQTSGSEGKPDENDLKQESQTFNKDGAPTEEANETSLDLNLGFRAHDGDNGTDQRMGEQDESSDQLGRTTSAGDVEMR